MTMLLERGITGTFVNDLLELSTSVEHRHYLSFLMSLRDFANGKWVLGRDKRETGSATEWLLLWRMAHPQKRDKFRRTLLENTCS